MLDISSSFFKAIPMKCIALDISYNNIFIDVDCRPSILQRTILSRKSRPMSTRMTFSECRTIQDYDSRIKKMKGYTS